MPATSARSAATLDALVSHAVAFAAGRLAAAADSLDPAKGFPRITGPDGRWTQQPVGQWTSGFFPGSLWQMYELTGDAAWRRRAERWTAPLEVAKTRTNTHDLGFLVNDSFGHGYRLTGNAHYRDVILLASRSLATRFNPAVGAIKSWDVDDPADPRYVMTGRVPVIVDNLMNLEMLFWAATQPGGDPRWKEMATRHAETSLRAHVRDDGSTAHVVLFDPVSGALVRRMTWQGHADTSAWARGQAWALYGLTVAARETGRADFLAGARRTADWFVEHLPADRVPPWDFRAPGAPDTERDASAGAIAASGLFELARLTGGDAGAAYRRSAESILAALCRDYLTEGTPAASVLAHSVGAKPLGAEVDVGIVYADYYLLEAVRRYRRRD